MYRQLKYQCNRLEIIGIAFCLQQIVLISIERKIQAFLLLMSFSTLVSFSDSGLVHIHTGDLSKIFTVLDRKLVSKLYCKDACNRDPYLHCRPIRPFKFSSTAEINTIKTNSDNEETSVSLPYVRHSLASQISHSCSTQHLVQMREKTGVWYAT